MSLNLLPSITSCLSNSRTEFFDHLGRVFVRTGRNNHPTPGLRRKNAQKNKQKCHEKIICLFFCGDRIRMRCLRITTKGRHWPPHGANTTFNIYQSALAFLCLLKILEPLFLPIRNNPVFILDDMRSLSFSSAWRPFRYGRLVAAWRGCRRRLHFTFTLT